MEPKDWVATLLAFVAIAISVWTVHAGHKQERLTAIPHLHITERFSPTSAWGWLLWMDFRSIIGMKRLLVTGLRNGRLLNSGRILETVPRTEQYCRVNRSQ